MQPGQRFGDLVIEARLGAGGMGTVYRVLHAATGARYALKVLARAAAPDEVLRFVREGEALARVDDHPHVVRVHAAGERDGWRYLLMQLCTGGDLKARLKGGGLPIGEAARLVADVARGVAHVHAHGVVHRDLKPENILFDEAGRARVSDFGLARMAGAESLTATGTLLGTPAYMAPEQANGSPVDARADVWALGGLLLAALTGRPPYAGTTPLNVIAKLLQEDPRWPSVDRPDTPPSLEAVVRRAMARRPEDRYPDAGALADDLERYLRGERPVPRRAAWIAVASVAGAASLLLAQAAWWSRAPAPIGAATPAGATAPLETETAAAQRPTSQSTTEAPRRAAPTWDRPPAGDASRFETPTRPEHLIFLDSSRLLVGHDDGVWLLDLDAGTTRATWVMGYVRGMVIADDRLYVARHKAPAAFIHTLDPNTLVEAPGSPRKIPMPSIASFAGSERGDVLAVGLREGGVLVIGPTGAPVEALKPAPKGISHLAVRADGAAIVCGTGSELHVIRREGASWKSAKLLARIPGSMRTVTFLSPDEVVAGTASGWLARVELERGDVRPFGRLLAHRPGFGLRGVALVGERLLLSAASDVDLLDGTNGHNELCAWDVTTHAQVWEEEQPDGGVLCSIALAPGGARLVLGYTVAGPKGPVGQVQVWEHP